MQKYENLRSMMSRRKVMEKLFVEREVNSICTTLSPKISIITSQKPKIQGMSEQCNGGGVVREFRTWVNSHSGNILMEFATPTWEWIHKRMKYMKMHWNSFILIRREKLIVKKWEKTFHHTQKQCNFHQF